MMGERTSRARGRLARVLLVCLPVASAALCSVCLIGPASERAVAQEPTAPPGTSDIRTYVAADTLEITAARPSRADVAVLRAGFATVHELSTDQSRPITVPDVIERGAGVHIRRYGGLGAYSVASVRGSTPGQVEVYLDGVPLRSGQWGVSDLSELPIAGVERIEVFRGVAPVEFGASPIGGVIHLVTSPPERASVSVSQTGGSYETWRTSLSATTRLGPVAAALSVSRLSSEGDYEYLNRNGTLENEVDDAVVPRRNNHIEQTNALLRLTTDEFRGWSFGLTDELLLREHGIPGIENVPILDAHADIASNLLRITADTPEWPVHGSVGVWHSTRRDRFYNPANEVGLHRSDTIDRTTTVGADGRASTYWHAGRQTLTAFASLRGERYVPEDVDPRVGVGFTRKRTTVTLAFEDRVRLADGRIEVAATLRHVGASDNYTGAPPFGAPPEPLDELHRVDIASPSLGLRVTPWDWLTVKAGLSKNGRIPTMLETFGAGGTVEANTELGPETARAIDGGVVLSPWNGRLFLEASVFRIEAEDLIIFLQNSQRTVKAFNLESARTDGFELSARSELGAWSLSGAYTRLEAVNTGPSPVYNGKTLPHTPEQELFARASWSDDVATFWYEHRWQSESWRDRANLAENRSEARHLAGGGFRFEIVPGRLALAGEIINAGNERTADVEGFPLPGRSAYATLEYTWMGER